MPIKQNPPPSVGLPLDDPRRSIKLRRLREEFARLPSFLQREPLLKDPEFAEWESAVALLLTELFGAGAFLVRFRQLHFRSVASRIGGPSQWYGKPLETWRTGLQAAEKVIGEAIAEAEELSGTTVPNSGVTDPIASAWSLLHPSVRAIAGDRFNSGHYADSVEAAIKELQATVRNLVKKRGGPELDGVALMQHAFSPTNPIIVLADLTTQSGKNMQRGYMELFAGMVSAIRNPHAHGNNSISDDRALHQLFVVSTLWYAVDERP